MVNFHLKVVQYQKIGKFWAYLTEGQEMWTIALVGSYLAFKI